MRPAEIGVKINIARREMEYWQGVLKDKRCGNCTQYVQGICHKFQAMPPPDVVKTGCDEWSWDEIPF